MHLDCTWTAWTWGVGAAHHMHLLRLRTHLRYLTWLHISHCGIIQPVSDVVARFGRPPLLQHKPTERMHTDLRWAQCVEPACRRLGGPR